MRSWRIIDWKKLTSREARKNAVRKRSSWLRARGEHITSTTLVAGFKNITRTGLVTHCWRYHRGKLRRRRTVPIRSRR